MKVKRFWQCKAKKVYYNQQHGFIQYQEIKKS